jgi:hypothetical protein
MATLDLLICRGIKRLQVMFLAECIYKTLIPGYLPGQWQMANLLRNGFQGTFAILSFLDFRILEILCGVFEFKREICKGDRADLDSGSYRRSGRSS